MNLTLRQLSYLMALAEERSFVRAAARVHVSQPALSMQIRELEENLGLALFERRPRDVRLTPAGRDVLRHAHRMMQAARDIEALARRQGAGARLHLGVIPTVAPYLLPRVLCDLRDAGTPYDLRLHEARTQTLIAELDDGRLDAIVIANPLPDRPDLLSQPLFCDRFVLAGSAARMGALAAGQGGAAVADGLAPDPGSLNPDHLLLLDEGHCLADQALALCGLSRGQVDLGASSLSTLVGMVQAGFGLTFLPEIALPAELAAAPELRVLRFAEPQPARDIALVRRADSPADGWFAPLAAQLGHGGRALVARAERLLSA